MPDVGKSSMLSTLPFILITVPKRSKISLQLFSLALALVSDILALFSLAFASDADWDAELAFSVAVISEFAAACAEASTKACLV